MRLRQLKPLPAPDDGNRVEGALSMMPRRLRITGGIAAACAAIAAIGVLLGGGRGRRGAAASPVTAAVPNSKAAGDQLPAPLKSPPRVAGALPPGQSAPVDAS